MTALPTNIGDARLPVTYENARTALIQCERIDECQSWADKAAALASYARQANDDELHKLATRIKARAIRRGGELLQEIKPSKGGQPTHSTRADAGPSRSRAAAGRAAKMSPRQVKTALRVASLPAVEFEAAVESEDPATITELAERGTAKPLVDLKGRDPAEFALATQAQGAIDRLAQFAAATDAAAVARGMFPKERRLIREPIEIVERWLATLMREIRSHERES
jgi:hypothetical protein